MQVQYRTGNGQRTLLVCLCVYFTGSGKKRKKRKACHSGGRESSSPKYFVHAQTVQHTPNCYHLVAIPSFESESNSSFCLIYVRGYLCRHIRLVLEKICVKDENHLHRQSSRETSNRCMLKSFFLNLSAH